MSDEIRTTIAELQDAFKELQETDFLRDPGLRMMALLQDKLLAQGLSVQEVEAILAVCDIEVSNFDEHLAELQDLSQTFAETVAAYLKACDKLGLPSHVMAANCDFILKI